MPRPRTRTLRLLPLALLAAAPALVAQAPLTGYSAAAAERQRATEAAAAAIPSAASAERHLRALTSEIRIAGTPAMRRTADYVAREMEAMGLRAEVRSYRVWLPHATSVRVQRLGAHPLELRLEEPPVPGDATSTLPQYPAANGYSGAGDVTAELVFVNYGLPADYAVLDSLGVSVHGRIAVARYGRAFRGIKAREAERRGAVALLLYSDPQDDGHQVGAVYPDGPMRPGGSFQRGSVMNGAGDPSTPAWASTADARRLPEAEMSLPRIPVVPLSSDNAALLLAGVGGARVPDRWQGALPFRYHAGPGPAVARVRVETDAATAGYKEIWNTFGVLEGTEFPDELVVIGSHRDAWGPGAADNASGTVSVLEAARAVAAEARAGRPPRRTVVFATWDAEEWGLIGSTEYVEDDSARLWTGGVAYLNQDAAVTGRVFGAGGSPSLRGVLRDVAGTLAHPSAEGSIYDAWRAHSGVADTLEPPMGDPGGGSDFAGFYNHLGIPHLDWGFGGPYGVYHSHYDSYEWMRRFGDPDFRHHAAAAGLGAALLLRLANADVLPYDYAEFARTLRARLPRVEEAAQGRGWAVDLHDLRAAIDGMEAAAAAFSRARDAALASGSPDGDALQRTNAALRRVERALTRPEGLRTRPWYRSLTFAADENDGYATVPFPSVVEAVRRDDRALAAAEVADLAARFRAASTALREATSGLGGVVPPE